MTALAPTPPRQLSLQTGMLCTDRKTGAQVRICKVTGDFIEWRDKATLSHGRMLRCYFPQFYQPAIDGHQD